MCVREYEWQIPFGVVDLDRNQLTRITEKPKHTSFVNAGIYVLEPELLDRIPEDGTYDMTTLFGTPKNAKNVVAFPIREYWLDVGYEDDLVKARGEFGGLLANEGTCCRLWIHRQATLRHTNSAGSASRRRVTARTIKPAMVL